METTKTRTPMQPRPVAELVEFLDLLSGKKRLVPNRNTNNKPQAYTTGKKLKPMTIAELQTIIGATPKQVRHPASSTSKPKLWNSSVKVDKSKMLTKEGQLKHSTARKVLNFPPKMKPPPPPPPAPNNRTTMAAPVPRKSIYPQARANGIGMNRISGVCKIPETPVMDKLSSTKLTHQVPKVKFNNISSKSDDDSFLQREQEINDFEEKTNAITEEPTLEKIAEISPPVSTPFKDYRNVREYFDHSEAENSVLWNNTITVFDKPTEAKEDTKKEDQNNIKREESVIVSLCEMLNKASVTNTENTHQELSTLEEHEREMENNIKMLDQAIALINSMKENQLKHLQYVRKLKQEKLQMNSESKQAVTVVGKENVDPNVLKEMDVTLKNENQAMLTSPTPTSTTINALIPSVKQENYSPVRSPLTSRPSVIKTKSPSYKIPRKSLCLRKKVFHKSLPNVSDGFVTPNKNNDRALSMYMQIKEHMTFLTTPVAKPCSEIPDTPAVTSHNLKKQLDKLYNE